MTVYPSQVAADLGSSVDSALAELGLPAWIIDRDGVVRWTNEKAVDLFGQGQGRHYSLFVARESINVVRGDFAKMILGSARTSDSEAVLRHRDGGRIAVEAHNIALADGRQVVGVFGLARVQRELPPAPLHDPLTPRQRQVLQELARGSSTAQIASILGIAQATVRNHIRDLLRNLAAHSRLEVVAEARRRGLID